MTGRKWIGALTLLATLISTSSFGSGPFAETRALGTVMMKTQSSVMINGAPAITGTTVFRGDVLQTRDASTALVKLRSGSSLVISENTEVALDLADPTAVAEKVSLHRGAINLRAPSQHPEWVAVSGASVLVQGDGSFPAICRIAMVGQSSAIINDRGHVEIRGSGSPLVLPIGQYATLEAGRPQGGSQSAGTVTAAIPAETVTRSGQTTSTKLNLQDAVYWGDDVQTQQTGRVRITLQDGSLLNIGARAEMKITKHDAQSHQTAIELTAGKLRSQVTKTDNTNYEVTTQTAVIGVVGTDFVVEADRKKKKTMVWCIDGTVKVRNINAAIVGLVLLHAGEFTTIGLGLAPAAAVPLSPALLQTQLSDTSAGTGASGAAGGGAGLGAHAALVGSIGASAGAGVGAGVASRRDTSTSGNLDSAGILLDGATSTLNNANSNSAGAQAAANSANQGSGTAIGLLNTIDQTFSSPSYPCGCH